MSLIFDSVSFSYNQENTILQNLNVKFPDTGLVVILGRSGCGKTTLLSLIIGSLVPTEGKIKKGDSFFASPVFQSPLLLPYLTVKENVRLPMTLNGENNDEKVITALKTVSMSKFMDRYPEKLSGGEKARVSIARSLVIESSLLVFDEPTGQLDEANSIEIMNLIKKLSENHLVILVTHDEKSALRYSDILYQLEKGTLVEIKKQNIRTNNISTSNSRKKKKGVLWKQGFSILSSFLKAHRIRTILTTLFLALSLSLLTNGINLSRNFNSAMSSLLSEYYDYNVLKISMKKSIAESKHLTLIKNTVPTVAELNYLNIENSYLDLSFFLPEYQEIGLNGHYASIRLLPVIEENISNLKKGTPIQDSMNVIVNQSFLSEFNLSLNDALKSTFSIHRSVLVSSSFFTESDFISSSFRFSISGIGKEKSLFNEPTAYYSYPAIYQKLAVTPLDSIRVEHPELETLGDIFLDKTFENEDILSHAKLILRNDIHAFTSDAQSKFKDTITISSKTLTIEESTSEILSSLLKIGFVFLLMALLSAFMMEFIAIYSLYDENLRLFALSKVYSKKENTKRFSMIIGILFLTRTTLFLLLFSTLESFAINLALSLLSYPSFLSLFDFPSFLITFLFSVVLCFLGSILPLRKIKKKNIKKELEGED